MPLYRYYADRDLSTGTRCPLSEEESRHLLRVLRAVVGQRVEIVNGRGDLAIAALASAERGIALVEIEEVFSQPPPIHPLLLAQALPRAPRLDFIVEKATELGASQIALFPGEKSERKTLSSQQWERLRHLTVAALKQCGSLYLPQLIAWPTIEAWPPFEGTGYFGDLNPGAPPLLSCFSRQPLKGTIAFCVGPESGLTKDEEELLKEHGWQGVSLHSNILRADTAPVVALGLLSSLVVSLPLCY